MSALLREIPDTLPSEMESTVFWASAGLGATGLLSVFVGAGDLAIITGAWAVMLLKLADQAGTHMNKDTALKLIAGVLTGIGGFGAGLKAAQMAFVYTGVGTALAMIVNAGTNAVFTYMVGTAAARVFLASDARTSLKAMVDAIIRIVLAHKS